MITTRFNPTTNGPIHLGHVYTLLVNEHFAHDNDGKFIVRFDDTSPVTQIIPRERMLRIMQSQIDDLNWLDVKIDEFQWQSELQSEARKRFLMKHKFMPEPEHELELALFTRMIGTGWLPFPYAPEETGERVIMDNMSGVTHIIRGEEFSTEFCLYWYFCIEKFKLPVPKFIFLPRLMGKFGDISKTNGGYTIADLRSKGYTPDQIKEMLAKACLMWYTNGWGFHNLKPNPRIDI